jgi:hypothetical protein
MIKLIKYQRYYGHLVEITIMIGVSKLCKYYVLLRI